MATPTPDPFWQRPPLNPRPEKCRLSKPRRIAFALLGLVLLLAVGAGVWLFVAIHQVPRFYDAAVKVEPARRKQGSDEMLRRSARLISDAKKSGGWQAVFGEDQINGWLAVDLVQNHSKLLPPSIHDPRVAIHAGRIVVGCRYEGRFSTIASLEAAVALAAPNVITVRILHARAGTVPLPLDKFMPEAIQALRRAGFAVKLSQAGADPMLSITVALHGDHGRRLTLESLTLREGEIDVAGETK